MISVQCKGGSYRELGENTAFFLRIQQQILTVALKENGSTDKSQVASRDLALIYQTTSPFQEAG